MIASSLAVLLVVLAPTSAFAAPALVQTNSFANSANGLSISVSYSSPPTAGNLLIAIAGNSAPVAVSSIPAGWSTAVQDTNRQPGQLIIYKVAAVAEPSDVTINYTGTGTRLGLQIYEYSGVPAAILWQTGQSIGSGSPASSASVTTTTTDELVIAGFTVDDPASFSAWTNSFTERNDFVNGGATSFQATYAGADRIAPTPGSYSTSAAIGGGNNWIGQIARFSDGTGLCPGAVVTTTVDSLSPGSLRACVIWANNNPGDDTITLPAGTYTLTLTGAGEDNALTGDLDIDDPLTLLTINGAGARSTIIDGNGTDRIFDLKSSNGDLSLSGMTLRNGDAQNNDGGAIQNTDNTITLTDVWLTGNTASPDAKGGAIHISSGDARVDINRATFDNNTAKEGGAIFGTGGGTRVNIKNATFTANSAVDKGGAMHIDHVALVNVTIVGNSATPTEGGGVHETSGQVFTATNTIIANNTGGDCISTIDSGNNNIDSDGTCGFATTADPKLGALADNGGQTDTMYPQPGSPAIEGGVVSSATVDQRSQPRPDGPLYDVGAVEAVIHELTGKVFEDADFAGTATDFGAGDLALASVDVELYSSTDNSYIGSTTTDGSGDFSFWVVDGDYKVRVRSATIGDNNTQPHGGFNVPCPTTDPASGVACAVAEQTWGNGAAAIGGQSATVDDTATNNNAGPGDTWSSVTVSGADVPNINMGFAYNLIVNTNNSGQGSLDRFIRNANAIGSANGTTANYSEFSVPVADLTAGVAVISTTAALPPLTDAGTTIDGETQTTNIGNTNAAVLRTAGSVGVEAKTLPPVAGPEVEIRTNAVIANGLLIQANDATVSGLAILGFGAANGEGCVVIDNNFTNATIEDNVFGTSAIAFADPGAALRCFIGVDAEGGDSGFITNNLFGFNQQRAIWLTDGSTDWEVQGNEVRDSGLDITGGDGIAISVASDNNNVFENLITGTSSQGFVVTSSTGNTFTNNTVTGNGVGPSGGAATESAAITMRPGAAGTTIELNIVQANYGAGIAVNNGATGTVITQNSFADNGAITSRFGGGATGQIGIDLNRSLPLPAEDSNLGTSPFVSLNDDGDTDSGGNSVLNFPILDTVAISGGNVTFTGWSQPGATIEIFLAKVDASEQPGWGEGETYVGTFVEGTSDAETGASNYVSPINGVNQGTDTANRFSFTVPIASLAAAVGTGDKLVATATVSGETSEFSGLVTVGLAEADLTLTVTDNPDSAPLGGPLLYTLLVVNGGPQLATDVTVTNTLPASVSLVSATPSQGSCSGTAVVTCNFGAIANGGTASIEILVVTSASGTITNNASVTAVEIDPVPADNSVSTDTDVVVGGTTDIPLTQYTRIHGFLDYVVTGGTLRSGDTSSTSCDIVASSSANLSGIPAAAPIRAAYLYWAASGIAVDDQVTLDGALITADRTFEAALSLGSKTLEYFGGFEDVTAQVAAKRDGLYTFAGLTVDNGDPWCQSQGVVAGWSMFVIYEDTALSGKTLVLYDGFDLERNGFTDYLLTGIYASPPPEAKNTVLLWEGDESLGTGSEELSFNETQLGDALNPPKNPYNSTINSLGVTDSYGVDLDTYDVSTLVNAGDTLATLRVDTGPDLVILNSVLLQVKTNIIAGRVFEDVNYGGGAGRDLATAVAAAPTFSVPRPGAIVELYDASGNFLRTAVTNASGDYGFAGLVNGSYTVRVVNDSVTSSRPGATGTEWPVQTFRTDGSGAVTSVTNEVGGANPAVQDDPANTTLANLAAITAQSLAPVTILGSAAKGEVDFGFNFDTIVNTNDSGQGSLREFIDNSNALTNANLAQDGLAAGVEHSIFMIPSNTDPQSRPTDPNYNVARGAAVIDLSSALPPIIDADTAIDGETQSDNIGTSNAADYTHPVYGAAKAVGAGVDGIVGTVDDMTLPAYPNPEIEIDGNNQGIIFNLTADNGVVKDIALFSTLGFSGIVGAADGIVIEGNYIGMLADGSDPGGGLRPDHGIEVTSGSATIRDNIVAYTESGGMLIGSTATITGNELYSNSMLSVNGDGISMEGTTGQPITITGNRIDNNNAYGIETWNATGPFTIEHNTVSDSGNGGGVEIGGIRIFGTGSTVRYNISTGAIGAGIAVVQIAGANSQNLISKNSTYANTGLSIDNDATNFAQPNGDGVTPNNGALNVGLPNNDMDYPVFTEAALEGSNLHVEGYVGTAATRIAGIHTIEVYKAADDGNNNGEVEAGDAQSVAHGEGATFVDSCSTAADGTFACDLTVPAAVSLAGSAEITGLAYDASNNTSEFGPNREVDNEANLVTTKILGPLTPGPFAEGGNVTYLLTVTNGGPLDATGVTAIETYPSELILGTATPTAGTYDSGTGIWAIGDLASGASATLTLDGTVDAGMAGDVVTNSVTAATGDQPDPTTAGDDLDEVFTVLPFFSIDDVTQAETDGATTFTFTVSINQAVGYNITFDINTADDTATVADSDYDAISGGSGTITNGSTSTTIDVDVTGDTNVELDEAFFVNLSNVVGVAIVNDQGTGTIENDDSAAVSIADDTDADEDGPVDGRFTVTISELSDTDTVVSYSVGGTATPGGTDYATLGGTVTILAGDTEAFIDVTGIVPDTLVEGTETVVVTLTGTDNAQIGVAASPDNEATINVLDVDAADVNIAATTDGDEDGPVNGVFTVTQTLPSVNDTVIAYVVENASTATSGTDYTALSLEVTIPAGLTTATIVVPVIAPDSLVEGTETVEITLDSITASDPGISIDNANANATINILDNDSATVSIAGTTDGNETGPDDGVFTVTQTALAANDTEIDYTVTGSATEGTDYDNLSGTVIILAGQTTATILIENIDQDLLVEGTETVIITLDTITASDPGVTIDGANNSDTIDILDGDAALVSIAGTVDGDEAGPNDGEFTVTQTTESVSDTVISYTVTGSATEGTDYDNLSGTVTILAGDTEATIDITGVVDDLIVEGTETVEITLDSISASDPGITIDGANNNDSINILDDDTATVSVAATTDANETSSVQGLFTLTQTTTSESATVVSYTVTGTATNGGTDYTSLTGTVTIPANTLTATIDVTGIIDDSIVEGTETVIVTLDSTDNVLIGIAAGPNNAATVNILDNDTATVSIAATTDANETSSVPGLFTLTQTTTSESATVVSYTVTGTATNGGTDYTSLTGTVTIPANTLTATIDVTGIIDDTIVEGTETVVVTLDSTDNVLIGVDATPATVNILDNDSATVSIAATTDANETSSVQGLFTLTQTTTSESATVVSYTVSGTATDGGTDYTTLGGTVTIPANTLTATIDVTGIIDDTIVEGTETVIVTLTGTDNVLIGIAAGPNNAATVNILDNDTATVSIAATTDANETSTANGLFTLTQTTTSESATVVSYTVSGTAADGGTDYTTLSGTVTIPANTLTATIDVTGIIDDTIVEGTETVIVTLTGTDDVLIGVDATPATVNILDNDSATVSIANSGDANETGTVAGEFTLTMTTTSESATVVSYNVTGSATNGGTDYTTLSGTVTILAGDTEATIDVTGINDDAIVEGTETVIVTLTGTDNPALIGVDATAATVNILDNDSATVSIANNGDAAETGTASGQFLLTMTTTSESATLVSYTVSGTATDSGTDYTTLTGTVTIPANTLTATIDVTGINDDTIVEGTETVIVTLTGTDNPALIGVDATAATVNILDNDSATVSIANNGDAAETGTASGQFLLTMTTTSESATLVSYTVSGTATDSGTDYTTLTGTVTIPANTLTATIDVTGINDDTIVEGTETVIVTLTGTDNPTLIGVDVTAATVNILDNDSATVSIANSGDANETGTVAGEFTLTMTTTSESATVVSYNVTGTATNGGTDYTTLPINVTIPAGSTSATIDVTGIIDDTIVEGTETVIVTLTGTDNPTLIGVDATAATVNILDNDTATVSIANNRDAAETGTASGQFLLTMTTTSESATVVSYNVTGTATNGGTDYTTLPINVTIPAGSTSATIDVTGINDDAIVEGTETVIVTLAGTDNPTLIGVDATPATVNILDNDSATVSIAATTDANEAGSVQGLFTLTQTTTSESATVVSYTVTGTATNGGTDYTTLPINVTIPAGSTSATIDVTGIIDDTIVEGTETVIVTLTGTDDVLIGVDATPATVNILDNDSATVSIAATTDANETGSVSGLFTLTQTTTSESATVVSYTVTGTATDSNTDYATLSGSVTIAAGATSATIDVTGVIDDTIVEGTETVVVTLTGTDDALIDVDPTPATVNILDNDSATVSIAATTDANETGSVSGLFTLTQTTTSESATVVSFTVSGTATNGGTDYTTLPINVTILANTTTATIDVTGIIDDTIVEGTETVIVTLTGTDDVLIGVDATPATVNILDNDSATVSIAATTDANETGTADGLFTLTQTTTSESATVVSYTVTGTATNGGTDYTTLPINVTIPANATTATIDVTGIIDDTIVEGTETVIVTLTGTDDVLIGVDATPATVNILDNDSATVSIAATTDAEEASSVDGLFTLTMTTTSESATVVSYSVAGTATDGGTDYTSLSGTVTIAANATSVTIDVTGIIDDTIVEGTETVIVTLTGTDDALIGVDATPATVDILDNDSATVSIAATTDANETGSVQGLFTLTQTTTSESATVVSYTVTGTATNGGTDYTTLPINVTIPANATSVTIDVTGIVDDTIVEGTETVIVTLTGTDDALIGVDATPATVNILDNDSATVSIAATTDANETGSVQGLFTLTQTTTSESATVVSYTVAGTATDSGTDYTTLSGSVTIAPNATSATIDVTGIIDDAIVEDTETVIVTLTGTDDVLIAIDATPATVNILDNDSATVSIAATTDANETGTTDGLFTLTQSTTSESATVVTYTVGGTATDGGTDYTSLTGTVTIAANATTATIDVTGIIDDTIVEDTETVIVTLTGTDNGLIGIAAGPANTATVGILDNDSASVSIAATTDANETGAVNGLFTLTQTTTSESATVVSYTVSGTATDGGTDYTTLSGTVTIPANATTATIDVTGIIDDTIVEDTETVIVTLTGTDNALIGIAAGPANTATVGILDNDSAAISIAATTDANETGAVNGLFTLTQTTTSESATVVSYTVSGTATDGGTDYTTLSGTVTIAANATSATIDVAGINDDAIVEGTETVIVTLNGTDNALIGIAAGPADTATVNILDNDSAEVSIAATTDANETGSVSGLFTLTQTTTSESATVVTYTVGGTATDGGTDYTSLTGTVTIAANATTATIDVSGIIDDTIVEGTETVIVTLTGTDNALVNIAAGPNDTATVDILDNDSANVSIAATTDANETGTVSGLFTLTQSTTSESATVVTYTVGGTATDGGTDYTSLTGTVTIAANATTATIDVSGIVDDTIVEGTETVIVTLTGTDNGLISIAAGPNDTATVDILDNDTADVSIAATTDAEETGTVSGLFTLTQSTTSESATVVTYTVGGTATDGGTDYTSLTGTVTIAANATTATIDVSGIVDDTIVEGTETVIVTLTGTDNGLISIAAGPNDTATVDILDNDTADVSIAATTDAEETGTVSGLFTLTQSTTSESATVVTYTVGGTATDGGTDYTSLTGTVTIAANATTATIDVSGIVDDTIVEGTETVIVTLTGTDNGLISIAAGPNDTATVDILDNDTAEVSVVATTDADETGAVNGLFTLTQSTTSESATVVSYSVTGTATDGGTDYTTLSGSVTIAANATTATIDVTGIIDDTIVEGTETVIVTLTGTDNGLINIAAANTATVDILDNDTAEVSVAATTDANETGTVNGLFTLTQTTTSESATVVSYNVTGTATDGGTDYTTLSGSVTIAANATTATIDVTGIIDDTIVEGTETVIVTLTGTDNGLINIAAANTATVDILDNDTAEVSVAATTDANETGTVNGLFTLTQTTTSESATVVSYSVSGTATDGGTDYTTLSGSVTIPSNATTATIDVTGIIDDTIVEGTETVIVTLDRHRQRADQYRGGQHRHGRYHRQRHGVRLDRGDHRCQRDRQQSTVSLP